MVNFLWQKRVQFIRIKSMLKTDLLVSEAEFRDVDEAEAVAHAHADARHEPGWQCNRKVFGLIFSLKNHYSFGVRFPTQKKW